VRQGARSAARQLQPGVPAGHVVRRRDRPTRRSDDKPHPVAHDGRTVRGVLRETQGRRGQVHVVHGHRASRPVLAFFSVYLAVLAGVAAAPAFRDSFTHWRLLGPVADLPFPRWLKGWADVSFVTWILLLIR